MGTFMDSDTFLVGRDGTILLAYRRARANGYAAEVLAAAKGLRERGVI